MKIAYCAFGIVLVLGAIVLVRSKNRTTEDLESRPPPQADVSARRAEGNSSFNSPASGKAEIDVHLQRAITLRSKRNTDGLFNEWAQLLQDWMKIDPLGALVFLASLENKTLSELLLRKAIQIWLTTDPQAARAYALDKVANDPSSYDWCLGPLLQFVGKEGGIDPVVEIIKSLPQGDAIYTHFIPVFGLYMRDNLAGARQVIDSLPYENIKPSLYEMFGGMSATLQGWNALKHFDAEMANSPYLEQAYLGTLMGLYSRDPDGVQSWLNQQPPNPSLDTVRLRVATSRLASDPKGATSTAAAITSAELREQAITPALDLWLSQSFAEAEAWAVDSDLDPKAVAAAILRTSPPSSESLAQKMNGTVHMEPKQRERQQVQYYQVWKAVDRQAANEWLTSSGLSENTKQMLLSLP